MISQLQNTVLRFWNERFWNDSGMCEGFQSLLQPALDTWLKEGLKSFATQVGLFIVMTRVNSGTTNVLCGTGFFFPSLTQLTY